MGCRCPATSRTFPCLSELLFCSGVGNRSYRRQTPQPEFSGRSGDHPASIAGRARRKRRARQALASEARAWAYKARWKRRSHPSPARSRQGGAVQLATEIAFWNPWASAGWSQILAGSLLEADFDNLDMFWAVLGLFLALLHLFLLFGAVLGCSEPLQACSGPRGDPQGRASKVSGFRV